MKKFLFLVCSSILFLSMTVPAHAVLFSFDCITNTIATDAATGEAQLFVEVTYDEEKNQVLFTFLNIGSEASSITDIYFDDKNDPLLLSFAEFVYDTDGVEFTEGAKPKNLPSGSDPLYSFTSDYSYDSAPEVQPNGVNPGETLGILFDLVGDTTFADILAALEDASLRIGIHVQGFDSGGSEGFINNPKPVPEPATMLLLGTGLVGLAGLSRKKFKK